ncbi:MAG: sulfatase-like hydrolase/transferase [Myxococcales bacterium]
MHSKVERALWALPLSFALLVARGTLALRRGLGVAELMYLADQALRMGCFVAVFLCLLAWLDARTRQRGARLVGSGLLAFAAIKAWPASLYLSHADALTRRGVAPPVTLLVSGASLAGLVIFCWRYQRAALLSRVQHVRALGVLWVLFLVDATIGFSQAGLVPFCYGAAAVILVVFTGSVLASHTKIVRRVGGALSASLVGVGLLGLWLPDYAERGRAELHRASSTLSHLDMHLNLRSDAPSLLATLREGGPLQCAVASPPPRALGLTQQQRKNVIVISIDSLRTDDAALVHQGRPLMPELSRFLREAWTSQHAYSAYPATLMSVSATFTGLLPSRLMMQSPAPPSILGSAFQRSHARVAVLPAGTYFKREPVEHYVVQGAQRISGADAAAQTRLAIAKLRELRARDQDHVLWVHYLEPHEPYLEHREFGLGSAPRQRYRSELAYVDRELGTLLSELRQGGWYDDSLIFVIADHGEAFGEHGQDFHHFQLYPWLIEVPFGVHVPGQGPRVLEGPVQLTDLAATAFEFLAQPAQLPLDGISLLSQEPRPDRAVVSEEFPTPLGTLSRYATGDPPGREEAEQRADQLETSLGYPSKVSVIQGDHQLILHRGTGVTELYDLRHDRGAQRNLAHREPARTQALERALQAWFTQIARSAGCPRPELSAAAR